MSPFNTFITSAFIVFIWLELEFKFASILLVFCRSQFSEALWGKHWQYLSSTEASVRISHDMSWYRQIWMFTNTDAWASNLLIFLSTYHLTSCSGLLVLARRFLHYIFPFCHWFSNFASGQVHLGSSFVVVLAISGDCLSIRTQNGEVSITFLLTSFLMHHQ